MNILKKYVLEIVVFFCGAIVMVFEIVGSRVLSPYLGSSIFTWTSIIGVILGSLSLGYYFGGVLADKKPNFRILSIILFLAAISVGVTFAIKDFALYYLLMFVSDIRISSVVASVILFTPASVFLGMVSPYAAKLKLENLIFSGRTIGNLYAISTTGSIFGTFFAGFYLIPVFGTNIILIILSIFLLIMSFVFSLKIAIKKRIFFLLFLVGAWLVLCNVTKIIEKEGFVDADTRYNRIWIVDSKDTKTGKGTRNFIINSTVMSAMFLENDELAVEYTKYYNLAHHFKPDFKKALMIGGAGYSYPKELIRKNGEVEIDVVEIDPGVTELARKYFKLENNNRMNIHHEDGRYYLNNTKKKYDVIFGDAFSSINSVPYQLATKEAVQKHYDILNEGGVVVLNIVSAINGNKGKFLRAEYATYKEVFPQVYLFPVDQPADGVTLQNIMLVAIKSNEKVTFKNSDDQINSQLSNLWKGPIENDVPVLTDDYSPVDYYMANNSI